MSKAILAHLADGVVLTNGDAPPRMAAQVPRHDGHVECQTLRTQSLMLYVYYLTLVDIRILMYLRYSQLIVIVEPAHQNLREKHV